MDKKKKNKTGIWALFVKLGSKGLAILAKFAKAFKFLKFGLAAASFIGYAYLFTWKFALLIMIALAWHESGHVWAMKRMGIKTKGFYFIPFIGGAAVATEKCKTYGQNAYIAIMGPIWGFALALTSYIAFLITKQPLFAASASWMAMINIFNLFPIMPLDGGQLMRGIAFSLSRRIGIVFLVISWLLCIYLTIKLKVFLLGLFVIIGALDIFIELGRRRKITQANEALEEHYAARKEKWEQKYTTPYPVPKPTPQVDDSPAPLKSKQFLWTVASYVLTTVFLILIVKLTQHIPGADLAANFLADK